MKEVRSLIFADKLNVVGFKFNPRATAQQKELGLRDLINGFVHTSQSLDFLSDKKLFMVMHTNGKVVAYNNGGLESVKINGADVQEKLGMKTPDVLLLQKRRQLMMQKKFKGI